LYEPAFGKSEARRVDSFAYSGVLIALLLIALLLIALLLCSLALRCEKLLNGHDDRLEVRGFSKLHLALPRRDSRVQAD
jgi:hypothetical protein